MFDTPHLFSKVSKKDKTTQSLNLLAYFHCMSLKSTSPALICGHDQTFAHVQLCLHHRLFLWTFQLSPQLRNLEKLLIGCSDA